MTSHSQDIKNSKNIMDIRRKAGNTEDKCVVCGHPAHSPYRRYISGVITEGCIDAHHTSSMIGATNTGNWHFRPEARELRAKEYFKLKSLDCEYLLVRKRWKS